jgi:prepilin-type N-terminal cleavage/methylation domain-containing protein
MTRPKSSGFTLIETLISMALAVVLILGTAGLLACSLKAKKKGDLASGLTQASAARIEALKAVAFDGPGLEPGDHAAAFLDEISLERLVQDWTVENEGGLKRILLRTRSLDDPESELRLVLYVSRTLGFRP